MGSDKLRNGVSSDLLMKLKVVGICQLRSWADFGPFKRWPFSLIRGCNMWKQRRSKNKPNCTTPYTRNDSPLEHHFIVAMFQ
jgi:hypothetical protein